MRRLYSYASKVLTYQIAIQGWVHQLQYQQTTLNSQDMKTILLNTPGQTVKQQDILDLNKEHFATINCRINLNCLFRLEPPKALKFFIFYGGYPVDF